MNVTYLDNQKKSLNFYIKQAHYEKALIIARNLINEYPKSSIYYQIMGKIQSLMGETKLAVKYLNKAIELDPKNSLCYNSLAIALSEMGQYKKSLLFLNKDLENGTINPLTYFNMGVIYEKINNFDKAIEFFLKAIKIKPYFPDACNNLGNIYYKQMEYNHALYYIQKSIKQNKRNSIGYHNLANILRSTGMYKDAINCYHKSLEIKPKQIETLSSLGLTYYDISKNNEGMKYFENILTIDKKYFAAKRNLAIGLYKTGNFKKAIQLFKETLDHLPNCITSVYNLHQLSSLDKSLDHKDLFKKFSKILSREQQKNKSKTNVISLIGFGRSGSLFLHSLLDGHPEISTLPGYFFKGWFSEKNWDILKPNFKELTWRETLADKICYYFEPQFNANSKKNVIGKPNGITEWLAKNLGFTQLGESCSDTLELNQDKFKKCFIDILGAYQEIDTRICFEVIHEAFDRAYRIHKTDLRQKKPIFYHLHNPSYYERASFHYHYPNSRSLFIVRNPIQMLESWLLVELIHFPYLINRNLSYCDNFYFTEILNSSAKIATTLEYFLNPLNSIGQVRGVKLEDLKKNSKETLNKISNWIGIKHDPSLFKSTFMNYQFSRPSINFNNITGFDTRSIDVLPGRVFGTTDLEIIETLFWPFMNVYGYTKMTEETFQKNIRKIRPLLDKPFQFEVDIYNQLPKDKPKITEISQFNELRRKIINIWEILNETKTYPNLIKPL